MTIVRRYSVYLGGLVLCMGLIVPDCRTVGAEEDPRYKILMSKDKRLCANVREVLNDDLINYGQGYDQRKFGAPIFSAIAWTPIKGLDDGFDYVGSVSHVDLNNDGTTDVLVRLETHAGPGGSIGVHELFIFKEDQYPQLAKKRRELEGNAVGLVIPHLQKEYELRDLPQKTFRGIPGLEGRKYYETLIAAVFIHPFRFQNTTYLLMTQSPDSPAVPNWAVVGKYKKGKLREADSVLMDDICYLNLK